MLLNHLGNTKPGLQDPAGLIPALWEMLEMSEAFLFQHSLANNQELRFCPSPAHKETRTLSNPAVLPPLSFIFFSFCPCSLFLMEL